MNNVGSQTIPIVMRVKLAYENSVCQNSYAAYGIFVCCIRITCGKTRMPTSAYVLPVCHLIYRPSLPNMLIILKYVDPMRIELPIQNHS